MYNGPDDWLNVLKKEKFYFKDREAKLDLIDQTTRHLHVRGGPEAAQFYLSDIMNQLSHLDSPRLGRVQRYGTPPNLDGETLHFFSDVLGMTLADLKPRLSHLGMKEGGRIYNLKFPDIHEYRMKFTAIIASDGSHSLDDRVSYYKLDPERKRIGVDVLREFGYFRVRPDPNDPKRVDLPKVMSSLAEGFGIPCGDKGIHNHGLHEAIIREKPEVKVHYLREVVPEDGSIGKSVIGIVRHNVLHAGVKAEKYRRLYGIEPVVTQKHIDFLCEHDSGPDAYFGYEKGDVVKVYISTLKKLALSQDENTRRMAKEIQGIIAANINRLLEDEVLNIAKPLGIQMRQRENYLLYYRNSKRLSLASSASTTKIEDYIRFNLIAPPNDPLKMEVAVKSLRARHSDVLRVREEITRDGLKVNPAWEEYDLW